MLPTLYAPWVDAILGGPIPAETEATCLDCAMCRPSASGLPPDLPFDPATKCCTFTPELPNFLVGAILSSPDPDLRMGRTTLLQRLQDSENCTPLGLHVRPDVAHHSRQLPLDAFGRTPALRCPHYLDEQGGLCALWRYRPAICTTWFCKYSRGPVGKQFWTMLHLLLVVTEATLARWCAHRLGLGEGLDEGVAGFWGGAMQDVAPSEDPALWGAWVGRTQAFYQGCYQEVAGLTWPQVVDIGGADLARYVPLVQAAYDELRAQELPPALRLGLCEVGAADPHWIRLHSYSPYDPLDLPTPLFTALPLVAAQPTSQALPMLAALTGEPPGPLLQKLLDFEVLLPAVAPTEPQP